MQRYGGMPHNNNTYALAQFLATTGPPEPLEHKMRSKTIFDRLRKKASHSNNAILLQQHQYQPPLMRHKHHRKHIPLVEDANQPRLYDDEEPLSFPTPPASSLHESHQEEKAIDSLVQTEPLQTRCDQCCRPLQDNKKKRRESSPAWLQSGQRIKLGQEATVLLALIDQLKQQLAEEQQSRKLLEKAIQSQWLEKIDASE
ncbi:uncharacterized protein BX664DRAFT_337253 [Halteromyces radiatus]|uniref:uncharacterized protein n=1 Tax=Halteromyces radiatus TaxID=101107 RepID=UPI00222004E5|nr:uncharacterized protein BX664DRAFT_337253 [Halteromyces radiatus]KAI8084555.1 hypothetical protein BX664DRAFT_337253 [Halteromyces radiatus]